MSVIRIQEEHQLSALITGLHVYQIFGFTSPSFFFFYFLTKVHPFYSFIFSIASPLARHTLSFYSLTWFAHAPFSHFGTTEVMGRSPRSHRWWNRILLNHGHALWVRGPSDEGFFTYIQEQSINSPALFSQFCAGFLVSLPHGIFQRADE